MKSGFVYILTNQSNKVIYTGVNSNLTKRIYEHKQKIIKGFTSKYNISKLVYFEEFPNMMDAVSAEKKIKGWLRAKKIKLIESINSGWEDLSGDSSLRSE